MNMIEKKSLLLGEWIWNVLRINFFWNLTNLLVLFMILNGLLVETIDETVTIIITLLIMIPLVLAPGTVASFSCARFFYQKKSDSIWNCFKKSYRSNYWISIIHGILYVFGLLILYLAFITYRTSHMLGTWILIFLSILLTVLFLFILKYTSDRKETVRNYWKLGFFIVINHPILSIYMILKILISFYLFQYIPVLFLFCFSGLTITIIHFSYEDMVLLEKKKMKL